MTDRITIPESVDSAAEQLGGLDRLVTAKEWERAAIVFAFTRNDDKGGRPTASENLTKSREVLTIIEFAGLGITGLRTQDTVRRYRTAWASTGRPTGPGMVVDLSGLGEFPPRPVMSDSGRREDLNDSAGWEGVSGAEAQRIALRLPAMKAAIKGDAKVAAAASAALDEVHTDFMKTRTRTEPRHQETVREEHVDALALMIKMRAAHRALEYVASMAQNIRGLGADDLIEAVIAEVAWIRGACDVIEAGANGGPLDAQLSALLDSEAGR